MYIYIYIYIHKHIYVYKYTYIYMCIYKCIHLLIYIYVNIYIYMYMYVCTCVSMYMSIYICIYIYRNGVEKTDNNNSILIQNKYCWDLGRWVYPKYVMGWLRLVGSLKLYVSFAKEPYKRDYILRKGLVILRSLLIVATPYTYPYTRMHV